MSNSSLTIACLRTYGNWRHVATGCAVLVHNTISMMPWGSDDDWWQSQQATVLRNRRIDWVVAFFSLLQIDLAFWNSTAFSSEFWDLNPSETCDELDKFATPTYLLPSRWKTRKWSVYVGWVKSRHSNLWWQYDIYAVEQHGMEQHGILCEVKWWKFVALFQ